MLSLQGWLHAPLCQSSLLEGRFLGPQIPPATLQNLTPPILSSLSVPLPSPPESTPRPLTGQAPYWGGQGLATYCTYCVPAMVRPFTSLVMRSAGFVVGPGFKSDPATYQMSDMGKSLNYSFLICEKGVRPASWVRIQEEMFSEASQVRDDAWHTVGAQ